MSIQRIIFHIGLPKAASSTLQVNYFRHISDTNHGYGGIWPLGNIGYTKFDMTKPEKDFSNLVKPLWTEYSQTCKPEVLHKIASLVNKPVVVLSSEFTTSAYHNFCPLPVTERLRMIKKYFDNTQIELTFILAIRDPIKMLVSQYYDHPYSAYEKNIIGRRKVISLDMWIKENIKYNDEYINTLRRSFSEKIKKIVEPYKLKIIDLDNANIDRFDFIKNECSRLGLPTKTIPYSENKIANYGLGEKYVNLCTLDSYLPKTKAFANPLKRKLSPLYALKKIESDTRQQQLSEVTIEQLNQILKY